MYSWCSSKPSSYNSSGIIHVDFKTQGQDNISPTPQASLPNENDENEGNIADLLLQ